MGSPQKKQIEFNKVYRRLESAERIAEYSTVLPTLEIIGNTTVKVYGSNLPRQLGDETYVSPIDDADIETDMTLTDPSLKPGMHEACLCTVWIAFIANNPGDPPIMWDCGLIDWEFEHRQNQAC